MGFLEHIETSVISLGEMVVVSLIATQLRKNAASNKIWKWFPLQ